MPNPTPSTTYDQEINQTAHRPGMEGVVNRASSTDDARDSSGNRTAARPTVSPPTRSAFGPDSASDPAPKAAPTPAAAPAAPDGSGTGGRQREQAIMDTVDKSS